MIDEVSRRKLQNMNSAILQLLVDLDTLTRRIAVLESPKDAIKTGYIETLPIEK